jgi:hypothetical protein
LTGKSLRNEPFGRPRNRWECDIKMSPKETGFEAVDLINVVQDRDKLQAVAT